MTNVNTIHGQVDASSLGATLMHEHVFPTAPGIWQVWPSLFGPKEDVVSRAVTALTDAYVEGIRTIVDASPFDLGRDVELLKSVADRVETNIVASTGIYEVPAITHTATMRNRSAEEFEHFFSMELSEGIEGTDIKAGVIKVAQDEDGVTEFAELVLRAAARTQKNMGAPIITHSHAGRRVGEQQAAILREEGVNPRGVVIGHSDDSENISYLTGLADQGFRLGMDRIAFGLLRDPDVDARARVIAELVKNGYGESIILSHDYPIDIGIGSSEQRTAMAERNPDSVSFISRRFLPKLRALGVTDDQLETLMVRNPRALFEAVGS